MIIYFNYSRRAFRFHISLLTPRNQQSHNNQQSQPNIRTPTHTHTHTHAYTMGKRSVAPENPLAYLGFAPWNTSCKHFVAGQTPNFNQLPPYCFFKEAIFVCLDLEQNCSNAQLGQVSDISEVGISTLDTRDLLSRQKPKPRGALAPGDQGRRWLRSIDTRHVRIEENRHDNCSFGWHKGDPRSFLFKKSVFIKRTNLKRYLDDWFKNLIHQNLAEGEEKRYIILLAFDSRMEEKELRLNKVKWYMQADEKWDIQDMAFALKIRDKWNKSKNERANIRELAEGVGLPVTEQMLHNAGNDSAFELAGMLAGLLVQPNVHEELSERDLPTIPRWWNPQALAINQAA